MENMDASSKKKLVAERGITLLTLVITVVIMIILAAVTINVTLVMEDLSTKQNGRRREDSEFDKV